MNNDSSDVIHNGVGQDGEGGVEEDARAVLVKLSLSHLFQSLQAFHCCWHNHLAQSIHNDSIWLISHRPCVESDPEPYVGWTCQAEAICQEAPLLNS